MIPDMDCNKLFTIFCVTFHCTSLTQVIDISPLNNSAKIFCTYYQIQLQQKRPKLEVVL